MKYRHQVGDFYTVDKVRWTAVYREVTTEGAIITGYIVTWQSSNGDIEETTYDEDGNVKRD